MKPSQLNTYCNLNNSTQNMSNIIRQYGQLLSTVDAAYQASLVQMQVHVVDLEKQKQVMMEEEEVEDPQETKLEELALENFRLREQLGCAVVAREIKDDRTKQARVCVDQKCMEFRHSSTQALTELKTDYSNLKEELCSERTRKNDIKAKYEDALRELQLTRAYAQDARTRLEKCEHILEDSEAHLKKIQEENRKLGGRLSSLLKLKNLKSGPSERLVKPLAISP